MNIYFTTLLLLAALPPAFAAAQTPSAEDLTAPMRDPEAMNYQLSMEKLRKLVKVQRALNALNAKDPQVSERIDRETRATAKQSSGPLTLAQKLAIIDRYPEARRMFTGAGGTAREWLLTAEAMGKAYTGLEVKRKRLDPEAAPPPTAALEANVALLEKNEAEFKKILEQLDRLADELVNE